MKPHEHPENPQAEAEFAKHRLAQAIGLMRKHHLPAQEISPILDAFDWKVIAQGGNTNGGIFDNIGFCPCEHGYTVATVQTPIAAWPNPAGVNNCAANPPAPNAPDWKCKDDCVQVMTHVWSGWMVVQDTKTGKLVFNCHTFAQYHCKKPNDPDRDKPPRGTDPRDPAPEL